MSKSIPCSISLSFIQSVKTASVLNHLAHCSLGRLAQHLLCAQPFIKRAFLFDLLLKRF
jgi:hypothetical protein